MSIKIEIHDGATPMLQEIVELNYGMGLDALDHAGIVLRNATRKAFRASTTRWAQYYRNGRRIIYKARGERGLGRRVNHQAKGGTANPANMSSFITSNLMAKSMTMVVGGKHGRLKPKIRKNGKVVGFATPVGATTKGSYAILQKLNSGDVHTDDEYYNKSVRSHVDTKKFRNPNYKKQNFIENGRSAAMGTVRDIMTNKLESLLQHQIDRANVTTKKVVTA